jgi:hypothetical protein
MSAIEKNYFMELFQSKICNTILVVEAIRHFIIDDENVVLTSPFFDASRQMPRSKGLWSSCSEDIFKYCCVWLDIGQFPTSLNSSNIALIPKGNSQTTMKDWRPIAHV